MKKPAYKLFFLAALMAVGCTQQNTENHTHEEGHAHEAAANEEEVHLVQQQMDVMDIQLGEFQYLNLSTTVKSNGQLELPPQNKASLSAVMGGRVRSISVLEGDYVTRGQVLATLEHPDFIEMQEQYMAARGQLAFIEKDYHRKKALYADSISSAKAFQQTKAEYQALLATVSGLKAKLQLLDLDVQAIEKGDFIAAVPVRSPINGYVRSIEINMGKFIHPGQSLFEIVDNEHIHIDLRVYEKDMAEVREGQKVIFSLSTNADSVFEGSIFAMGRAFEEEPKAMVVHAEIDNKGGNLLPGMYVDARIVTEEQKVRALPDDAIVSVGGLQYIFVLKPGGGTAHHHEGEGTKEYIFRKIEVNTGASDIGFTEVVPAHDLPEHAEIVTKGAFYLLAEMKKGEGGHGHHH